MTRGTRAQCSFLGKRKKLQEGQGASWPQVTPRTTPSEASGCDSKQHRKPLQYQWESQTVGFHVKSIVWVSLCKLSTLAPTEG